MRFLTFLCAATLLLAADTSWTRVKALSNHSELRIFKNGQREPVTAAFNEANDERIIVVVKNQEVSIPKSDIDHIDARPAKTPRKMNVATTEKETPPDYIPHPVGGPPVPGATSSSNVSFSGGGKEFETVYRRAEGETKK